MLFFRFLHSFITFSSLIKSSFLVTSVLTLSLFNFPDFPKRFFMMEFGETSESEIKSLFRVFSKRVVSLSFALSSSVNALI